MRDIDNRRLLLKAGGIALAAGAYKMVSAENVNAQEISTPIPEKSIPEKDLMQSKAVVPLAIAGAGIIATPFIFVYSVLKAIRH